MKRFTASALIIATLSLPASAFTFSLPDLSFPGSATTISTQACAETVAGVAPICK